MTEMIPLWISIITPLLVIIGWLFVYRDANRIARRAEAYSIVDKTIERAIELDKRCAEFWLCKEGAREESSVWLAGTLAEIYCIRTLLELLENHHDFKEKNSILVQLRRASTLDAERVPSLPLAELKKKKQKQSEALGSALAKLYAYYRAAHD